MYPNHINEYYMHFWAHLDRNVSNLVIQKHRWEGVVS
jgi:hypothetical protein